MIVDVAFEDGSVSLCRIEHELNACEYLVREFVCHRNGTCKLMVKYKPSQRMRSVVIMT